MEVVGVVLGGLACVLVWLLLEFLGAAAATGISEGILSAGAAKGQAMLEHLRRERSEAVVFLAQPDGGLGTTGGWRCIVADSSGITAYRSPEREAWTVPWADVRSLTERFNAIRLDDGRTARLFTPASAVDELTARALIPPLIGLMRAQRPASAPK